MTSTESIALKKTGLRWIESAAITWPSMARALTDTERRELADWLDSLAERAVRLSGYLEGIHTSEDIFDHPQAVKRSNRKVSKVRKAIGFTQPRNDITF